MQTHNAPHISAYKMWLRFRGAPPIIAAMTTCTLPTDCQKKFAATTNCIECGVWVDAMVILGDIAFCPLDDDCTHHDECAQEAARCASDLHQGSPLRSRLLNRLRHLLPVQPLAG